MATAVPTVPATRQSVPENWFLIVAESLRPALQQGAEGQTGGQAEHVRADTGLGHRPHRMRVSARMGVRRSLVVSLVERVTGWVTRGGDSTWRRAISRYAARSGTIGGLPSAFRAAPATGGVRFARGPAGGIRRTH
ncbi:hypothetical protein GCM10028781_15690 [Nostocoides australiense]